MSARPVEIRFATVSSALALLWASGAAFGQEGTAAAGLASAETDIVVVTATRTAINLSDAPASLSVVTSEDIELANAFDVYTSNDAFKDYVGERAAGFGLEPISASVLSGGAPAVPLVQGQVLQQVQADPEPEPDYRWVLLLLLIAGPFLLGIGRQATARPSARR